MFSISRKLRRENRTVGFVATMGALHEGHFSLIKEARQQSDVVIVSIFVNPAQFNDKADLEKYPRDLTTDAARLAEYTVDYVFAPELAEVYPPGFSTYVYVENLSELFEGASRPGHFTGVATVVAKLFHIVAPHRAYFGQKDAAQLAVLRQMVCDLNFDLAIIGCPIVRAVDGLALSSRNQYLSAEERVQALALPRALQRIQQAIAAGERDSQTLVRQGLEELHDLKVDYLATVDANTLLPVSHVEPGTLVALAAWVGKTRLIDNLLA